jgi:RHS repeat-associated protein
VGGSESQGRIGIIKPNNVVYSEELADYFSTTFNPSGTFSREINQKFYAIKDHLGSERVVISDVKEPNSGLGSGGSEFYTTNISVSNYYPFGSLMSDISRSSEEYRYGYNGKENDDEISGKNAITDYGARTYANRLGRFLSTDPLKSKFPNQSSYIYAGNNPILFIDKNGEAEEMSFRAGLGISSPRAYKAEMQAQSYIRNNQTRISPETMHIMLDIGGMVPIIGEPLDLLNAGVYASEGDYLNAGLSASAMIPLAGDALKVGKYSKKALQLFKNKKVGAIGEAKTLKELKLTKNTKSIEAIDPKTGKLGKTIPDALDNGQTVEIKNVKRLSDSPQLRRQSEISGQSGQKAKVVTGKETKVSNTVRDRMKVKEVDYLGPQNKGKK